MKIDVTVLRVFTDEHGHFGNLLGVVDAGRVEPARRQRLAAQLGYSETVFVAIPDAVATIYTPRTELTFAGHPTVGATWWLRRHGFPTGTLQVPAGLVQTRYDEGLTGVRARAAWGTWAYRRTKPPGSRRCG